MHFRFGEGMSTPSWCRRHGEKPAYSYDPPIEYASNDAAPADADRPGLLVVISGPSGVGKSTIVERLGQAWPFEFSVSATTRPPRPGEEAGTDYQFVNQAVFNVMVETDQFLEWAEYAGNLYGTPRRPVLSALAEGRNVLLGIEVKGAVQVMDGYNQVVTIFIMPPSIEELEQRLRGRDDTDDTAIKGRMAVVEMEMAVGRDRFQHRVVNESVEAAIGQIVGILERESASYAGESSARAPHIIDPQGDDAA